MAISKRLRYEILRRDNYTCRYCGAKAPDAPLTVDHVTPAALGGSDTPDNLVAACRDCNGGKTSSNPDAPLVADVAEDALRWAASVRQALAELGERDVERMNTVNELAVFWHQVSWPFSRERLARNLPVVCDDATMQSVSEFKLPDEAWMTLDRFLRRGLTPAAIRLAMEKALYITPGIRREDAFRYFCGICWRTIDEAEHTAARGADQ